ncbi:MAG TPA: hypothetical protein PLE72_02965, partial [Azospira sp.]|nr:hypothetical protein [Azospira sp.]
DGIAFLAFDFGTGGMEADLFHDGLCRGWDGFDVISAIQRRQGRQKSSRRLRGVSKRRVHIAHRRAGNEAGDGARLPV